MLDPIHKHLRIGGVLLTLLLAFIALYMAVRSNDLATAQQRTEYPSTNALESIAWSNSLLLQESDRGLYTPSGRNIFQLVSESIHVNQPPHSPKSTPTPSSTPNGTSEVPAPQPRINLTFYGFIKKAGTAKRVFLQDGESIFAGSEGEVIDRHYKIVRVAETSIEIQDLLTNQYETLKLQHS